MRNTGIGVLGGLLIWAFGGPGITSPEGFTGLEPAPGPGYLITGVFLVLLGGSIGAVADVRRHKRKEAEHSRVLEETGLCPLCSSRKSNAWHPEWS